MPSTSSWLFILLLKPLIRFGGIFANFFTSSVTLVLPSQYRDLSSFEAWLNSFKTLFGTKGLFPLSKLIDAYEILEIKFNVVKIKIKYRIKFRLNILFFLSNFF